MLGDIPHSALGLLLETSCVTLIGVCIALNLVFPSEYPPIFPTFLQFL